CRWTRGIRIPRRCCSVRSSPSIRCFPSGNSTPGSGRTTRPAPSPTGTPKSGCARTECLSSASTSRERAAGGGGCSISCLPPTEVAGGRRCVVGPRASVWAARSTGSSSVHTQGGNNMTEVIALYDDRVAAERAAADLYTRGFDAGSVGYIDRPRDEGGAVITDPDYEYAEDDTTGTAG